MHDRRLAFALVHFLAQSLKSISIARAVEFFYKKPVAAEPGSIHIANPEVVLPTGHF